MLCTVESHGGHIFDVPCGFLILWHVEESMFEKEEENGSRKIKYYRRLQYLWEKGK